MSRQDPYDYDHPIRVPCPIDSPYAEVDLVRHRETGVQLCEVFEDCPNRKYCDWGTPVDEDGGKDR
jgi:hypothetical protein